MAGLEALLAPGPATYLGAAVLMLLLAGALVRLNFEARANRAFAAFLLLRASLMTTGMFAILGIADPAHLLRMIPYLGAGQTLAVVAFVLLYPHPRGLLARLPAPGSWFLAAGLAVATAFVLAGPCLSVCFPEEGPVAVGPVGSVLQPLYFYQAAGALLLAVSYAKMAPGRGRESLLLVAMAFVLNGLSDGIRASAEWFVHGANGSVGVPEGPWSGVIVALEVLSLVPALLAVAVLARTWRREGVPLRRHRVFLGFAGLAVLSGLSIGIAYGSPTVVQSETAVFWFVAGFWRLTIPVMTTYAILRHQLFDIDVRIKWGIQRGTVAAAFVGVFFVAATVAQEFLADELGWALGGVAAGTLVFAISPLQRVAQRIADKAMPGVHDAGAMAGRGAPDRQDAFKEAVRMALSDGVVTREEERALAKLAAALGLRADEAFDLRETVEREGAPQA